MRRPLEVSNIVVWQISSAGIVLQVNRIDVGQANTRHLRWVNELHFETTDIPFSFCLSLPLHRY
jgi:hypothetical protein